MELSVNSFFIILYPIYRIKNHIGATTNAIRMSSIKPIKTITSAKNINAK